MNDAAIKNLCKRYAHHFGHEIEMRDQELWILKPGNSSRRKGWVLCFHRDLIEAHRDAQLVAPGSPVLAEMRKELEQEPDVGELFLAPAATAAPQPPWKTQSTLEVTRTENCHLPLIKYQFSVVFYGMERSEELFPVVVDEHGREATARLNKALKATAPQQEPPKGWNPSNFDEEATLEAAFTLADGKLQPLAAKWQDEAQASRAAECSQAEEYFAQLIDAEEDAARKAELRQFRAQRIKEIAERYEVRVELEVQNAVVYHLPYLRAHLRLQNPSGCCEFQSVQDLVTGQWRPPNCHEHPDRVLDTLSFCPNHGLTCPECHWNCPNCQRDRCGSCPKSHCTHCGAKVCRGCLSKCSACSRRVCPSHLQECGSGCGKVCETCAHIINGEVRCDNCTQLCSCQHRAVKIAVSSCFINQHETFCPQCVSKLANCSHCKNLICTTHRGNCRGGGELVCDSCGKRDRHGRLCDAHATVCSCGSRAPSREIHRCDVHHLSRCSDCSWQCVSCGGPGCSTCYRLRCSCGGDHCQKCTTQCKSCGNSIGAIHAHHCLACKKTLCEKCLVTTATGEKACKQCTVGAGCGCVAFSQELETCVQSETYCGQCARSRLVPCSVCKKKCCSRHRITCHVGREVVCKKCPTRTAHTGEEVCAAHSNVCACGRVELAPRTGHCPDHRSTTCRGCAWYCQHCGKNRCKNCRKCRCDLCKSVVCEGCAGACHVCSTSRVLCNEHRCPDCRRHSCPGHARQCSSCGSGSLCPACNPTPGDKCILCQQATVVTSSAVAGLKVKLEERGLIFSQVSTLKMAGSNNRRVVQAKVGLTTWWTFSIVGGQVESCVKSNSVLGFFGFKGSKVEE